MLEFHDPNNVFGRDGLSINCAQNESGGLGLFAIGRLTIKIRFPKSMTDTCDRSRDDVEYRRDVSLSMDVGFDVPKTLTPKIAKRKKSGPDVSVSGVIGREAEVAVGLS